MDAFGGWQSGSSVQHTIAGMFEQNEKVRRPIQVRRTRRGAGCVARPQKVWLTSCPGAVRWHYKRPMTYKLIGACYVLKIMKR